VVLGISLRACRITCILHYVYSKASWGWFAAGAAGIVLLLGTGLLLLIEAARVVVNLIAL
jgi:ABC-type phosphate transport system auxiliary subunit